MIRSILIALAEPPFDASAQNVAFWLAKKEGSRLHALAVIDITAFEVPVLGGPDSFMPSVMTPPLSESRALIQDLMADARKRLDVFAGQCSSRGLPVFTEAKTGIPGEVISRTAVAHDLVIVSRTGYNRIASAQETVDAWIAPVVRNSVRPVLVAGAEFREGSEIRSILVAYDGSPHASRALLAAAELAMRPGVQCSLVTVAQSDDLGREVLAPAETFLSNHGVTCQKRVIIHSKPSDVICELAASGGFDIVVMGAYGHSPIREVLFGSATERILSHCATNVILQA
ncbi:MAG TPA: universal stress protein [Acidobacteriota bacterium]|nr:universal stress protein [Acidobacteriota bacterium]